MYDQIIPSLAAALAVDVQALSDGLVEGTRLIPVGINKNQDVGILAPEIFEKMGVFLVDDDSINIGVGEDICDRVRVQAVVDSCRRGKTVRC